LKTLVKRRRWASREPQAWLFPEFKDKHPALISEGEFLQPMVRKDDRNGNPIAIGPIPWAFLHVKKIENSRLNMDLYSGRSGGLQGRKNARTFRMALRTRPVGPSSTIRLHAAGSPADALAGYEVYEKKLRFDRHEVGGANGLGWTNRR
jgi:hypothetical protein